MTGAARLFDAIVRELRLLDEEAIPLADGTPTGLWWYHRFLQGDGPPPGKYRNEEKIFAALGKRLCHGGCPVALEEPYAERRASSVQRCDMAFAWEGLGRVWMEVKGAWRHADREGRTTNKTYLKHLYSAADDLRKLATAPPDRVDAVSFLLVGFDHAGDPITEANLEIVRGADAHHRWVEQSSVWKDRRPNDGRVRVWMWARPLR